MNVSRSTGQYCSLLLHAILLVLLSQPLPAKDLKTWEKQLKQNYQDYKKAQEIIDNPDKHSEQQVYEAGLRQRQLFATRMDLKRRVMRKGGDYDAMWKRVKAQVNGKTIIVKPDGTVTGSKDGKNTQTTAPGELRPWDVTDPISRNAQGWQRDKAFIQRCQNILQKPTKWRAAQKLPAKGNTAQWQAYWLAKWKPMFRKYRKRALDRRDLDFLKNYSGKWAKNRVKQQAAIAELSRFTNKGTQLDWIWLKDDQDFATLKKRYLALQDSLRKQLLLKKENWSRAEAGAHRDSLDAICRQIVDTERRLVWLLGSAASPQEVIEEESKLLAAEKLRSTKLGAQQKAVYEAWLNFQLLSAYWASFPDTESAGIGSSKRDAEKDATAAQKAYLNEKYKLTLLKQAVEENGLGYRMKRGLHRALSQKTFRPHKLTADDKTSFYNQILGWTEYKVYWHKGFFKMCHNYFETLNEFLSEKEQVIFLKQSSKRKNALGR